MLWAMIADLGMHACLSSQWLQHANLHLRPLATACINGEDRPTLASMRFWRHARRGSTTEWTVPCAGSVPEDGRVHAGQHHVLTNTRLYRHARLGSLVKSRSVQDLFLKTGEYMRDNILKAFPPEFQGATRQSNVSEGYDMMTRPDLDKHVFMRVLEDRGAVELDAEGCAALPDWASDVLGA